MTFECRTRGDVAFLAAESGQENAFETWDLAGCAQPPTANWNGSGGGIGSQNYRPPVEIVRGDIDFFPRLAEVWLREGIWGREWGSEIYTVGQLAAWVLAYRRLWLRKAWEEAHIVRRMLRATWTMLSLIAVPVTIRTTEARVAGEVRRPKGERNYYPQGVTVALAGERWNDAAAGQKLTGPALAWALDLPRRYDRYDPSLDGLPEGPPEGGMVRVGGREVPVGEVDVPYTVQLTMLGMAFRDLRSARPQQDYRLRVPPGRLAMHEREREVLAAVVRGEPAAAREAVSWLDGIPVWQTYDIRLLRTEQGAACVFLRSANRNKPAQPASAISVNGEHHTIRPSRFKGTGATPPEVRIDGSTVVAAADGHEERLELPGGRVLWDLRWTSAGIEVLRAAW